MKARARRVKEMCAEKNVPFKTLYCGRRGLATLLTQLTGDPLAAAQALRHGDASTTMAHYIKLLRPQLKRGMDLVDAKLLEKVSSERRN